MFTKKQTINLAVTAPLKMSMYEHNCMHIAQAHSHNYAVIYLRFFSHQPSTNNSCQFVA